MPGRHTRHRTSNTRPEALQRGHTSRPETRKIDIDVDDRLVEGVFDIRRGRTDVGGRADQICDAAPQHKWRSEGWSPQARGGFEGVASTSTAPWVLGGPWAWARSPEACVRGAASTLCGVMRCEHEELVVVKVSVLHHLRHIDRGGSHRRATRQNGSARQSLGTVFDGTATRTGARRQRECSAHRRRPSPSRDRPLFHK